MYGIVLQRKLASEVEIVGNCFNHISHTFVRYNKIQLNTYIILYVLYARSFTNIKKRSSENHDELTGLFFAIFHYTRDI